MAEKVKLKNKGVASLEQLNSLRDNHAEKAVIGMYLTNPQLFDPTKVRENFFLDPNNCKIFTSMLEIFSEGNQVDDLITLKNKKCDIKYLQQIISESGNLTPTHLPQILQVLEKFAIYREVVKELDDVMCKALEAPDDLHDFMGNLNSVIVRILDTFKEEKSPYISNIVKRLIEVREEFKNKGDLMVIKTGFADLDKLTGGLLPRFVWIVGAWTNTGKSFFALQILLNALRQGKKCILFSLEMSDLITASRLLGNMTNVGSLEIYQGKFDTQMLDQNMQLLAQQNLLMYDNKLSMSEIATACIKESAMGKIDLIIIDYVQNLMDKPDSSYENMVNAVKMANVVAERTGAAILLVSQLSNEAAKGSGGKVSGYKGAGELQAGPDVGLVLERVTQDGNSEIDKETILCKVSKNRHGPLGRVWLKIDPATGFIQQHPDQHTCDVLFRSAK